MESERSSSDAALRMLFVEDVELLEFGISELMKGGLERVARCNLGLISDQWSRGSRRHRAVQAGGHCPSALISGATLINLSPHQHLSSKCSVTAPLKDQLIPVMRPVFSCPFRSITSNLCSRSLEIPKV
ncbi:hypothetical protein Q8A67_025607 [Cirrhinus molitorella]|uniref:Uncharacterized protein n=1 Tax=Cirrhinus molitorella TaxID=172907 RepID=A0AA88NXW7_9TELE|nr:hypothetical protein Q8A67_025607 [Cirrhinus molitorella]